MRKIDFSECREIVKTMGRTLWDNENHILLMNWTCSGVEFCFQGTQLLGGFRAWKGIETDGMPFDEEVPRRDIWPFIAVFLDGNEEPCRMIHLTQEVKEYVLYEGNDNDIHRIQIVKLTEHYKTKVGITHFAMEGELHPIMQEKLRKQIEFIGDSITCGFGNMTAEKDKFFYTEDENGWMSHAAIAARMLNMDCQMICVSGICSAVRSIPLGEYGMNELYPYTDLIYHNSMIKQGEPEKWDFKEHPSDYIVINLGTNDATAIMLSEDQEKETKAFCCDYLDFVKEIRRLNGTNSWIICALGSMDYYLYHDIVQVIEKYKQASGDRAISCFRYKKMSVMDPIGACYHPHVITQQKMAREIAEEIKRIEAVL